MHRFLFILLCITFGGILTSCFKSEPLNTECDIEQASLPDSLFINKSSATIDVLSNENAITFFVKEEADLSELAPTFVITSGATISPASGSAHDFTNSKAVTYKVTSQDGEWSREYTVRVETKRRTVDDLDVLGFEDFYLDTSSNRYYVWDDKTEDGYQLGNWASGNPGFALSMSSAQPDDFPTAPLAEGYSGNGVKLVTRSTGALGEMVKKPIAAGNLFMGKFDILKALTSTLQATAFGVPVTKKPVKISGYYTYQPGEEFTDVNGSIVSGRTDQGNIYAVLYKNTDNEGNDVTLHGDDVKTNANIVALADMGNVEVTSSWTYFEINFNYTGVIDEATLANYGYDFTLVFTSSIGGDVFEGAIGSTLTVDEVTITWE